MTRPRFLHDRSLILVLLLAVLIVFPRSAMIATAHSESIDDEYHLVRGVRLLQGTLETTKRQMPLNDPPLGETIMALPLWLMGAQPYGAPSNVMKFGLVLHRAPVSPEFLQMTVATLKAALFVPFVAFCFAWIRRIYNAKAAWAAAIILLIEPTITAHLVPAALDVMGFEAIVIACWAWWRYFAIHRAYIDSKSSSRDATPSLVPAGATSLEDQRRRCVAATAPASRWRVWLALAIAAAVSGAAMLIKHTAIILPAVALAYAGLYLFFVARETNRSSRGFAHAGST